jgi:hypothetical protein
MIQRIQTVYLFLGGLIAVLALVLNFQISSGQGAYNGIQCHYHLGVTKTSFVTNTINNNDANAISVSISDFFHQDLIYFLSIVGILSLVGIFMYKNLQNQLRLTGINFVFILGALAYVFIKKHFVEKNLGPVSSVEWSFQISILALLPFFNYLAFKNIKKDIQLLASVDRLR